MLIAPTLTLLAIAAVALPALLTFHVPPSPTVLNQAVAWFGWGAVAFVLALRAPCCSWRAVARALPLLAALLLLIVAALSAPSWAGVPWSLAGSTAATLACAIILVVCGAAAASNGAAAQAFIAVCVGLLVAGVTSLAIGVVQVYAPGLADGEIIALASDAGRASGNLRQPNHLATLLTWALVAAVWAGEARLLRPAVAFALGALFVFGVVLTASRTGAVCLMLLAVWGAVDRGFSRKYRLALLSAPVLYGLLWLLLTSVGSAEQPSFSGGGRLKAADPSRFAIWSNTLALIADHPWRGIGINGFNFAWTLTPFPLRPTQYFDHCHNLALQLFAELGAPLGGLVAVLLVLSLWWALRAFRAVADPAEATARRSAFVMLILVGVHSMLEYPLWYAYFLFPTAFLWGLCLGDPAQRGAMASAAKGAACRLAGLAGATFVLLGGAVLVRDYAMVAAVFAPTDTSRSLEQRIDDASQSWFFGHHADYARATAGVGPQTLDAFARPVYYLLDARLMVAWSTAFARSGDLERARHIAERLREFHRDEAQAFLAPCVAEPRDAAALPFQCQRPSRELRFEDFR